MSGRSPQSLVHGAGRCCALARPRSGRRIGTLLWLAVSAGPLLLNPPAFAKNLEKTPTPVSVEAKPALVIAGGTVTIKGSSVPLGKHSQVTLTIQPPSGPPVTEKVPLKSDGKFETKFVPKGPLGKYSVTARAPDGKASAHAEFTVGAPAMLSKEVVEKVDRAFDHARKVVQALDQRIQQAPPSPAQEEVKQKLGPLKERLSQVRHSGTLMHLVHSVRLQGTRSLPLSIVKGFALNASTSQSVPECSLNASTSQSVRVPECSSRPLGVNSAMPQAPRCLTLRFSGRPRSGPSAGTGC